MTDELALPPITKVGELDLAPAAATIARFASFKEGALSKLSDDDLSIVAGRLYAVVKVLVNLFARHASIEQVERLGPIVASLLKTLESKMKESADGKMLTGGGESDISDMWTQAFQKAQSGGNPPGTELAVRTGAPAAAPAAPAAPGAMALAPAAVPGALAAPGAPMYFGFPPDAALNYSQAQLTMANVAVVNEVVLQQQQQTKLGERHARYLEKKYDLAEKIIDQADPLSPFWKKAQAITGAVAVEGMLVGVLYFAGKGAAGIGLIGAVAGIQIYSTVSSLDASKVLSGLGAAIGGAVLSVGTGIGGGVANAISSAIGMGPVTGDVNPPTIASATGQPKNSVLVEGRGFTPGVAMPEPDDPMSRPEFQALMKIQELAGRIDFVFTELFRIFFGDDSGKIQAFGLCIASVAFLLLYYVIGHLVDVWDTKRVNAKNAQANAIVAVPFPAPPGQSQGQSQGQIQGAIGNVVNALVPRRGGKKRRTLRKNNPRATRHKKKATKVLGTPVFVY
jgi:hypothetical protein